MSLGLWVAIGALVASAPGLQAEEGQQRYTSRTTPDVTCVTRHAQNAKPTSRCRTVAPWSIPLHHGAPRCDGWRLGWWGARKRGVPLPCVTIAYATSSHALQRSVTNLRPTTSTPVHVGLPRLRIPQWRSAFFPERNSPFPRKCYVRRPDSFAGRREQ